MIHQPVIKKVVSGGGGAEGWNPPADWGWDAASALVGDGDNGFVGLIAVFPGIIQRVALVSSFSGSASINYGDGTGNISLTSGVKAEHEFDYNNIPGTITSFGYKVAIVYICATGGIINVILDQRHSLDNNTSLYKWLGVKFRSTYISAYYQNQELSDSVEIVDVDCIGMRGAQLLYSHLSAKKVLFTINKLTNTLAYAFWNCAFYFDWNAEDYAGKTDFTYAWQLYHGQSYDLNISIPDATTLSAAFIYTKAFRNIKLTNTNAVSNIGYCLYQNFACENFEMTHCAAITNTTTIVNNPGVLKRLILSGLAVSINISGQLLSATALNAFFTSLGTANGAQTITVTGNPGAATCDTSIATAKGFTVVT